MLFVPFSTKHLKVGAELVLHYAPGYADPNPLDGSDSFSVTVDRVDADSFDAFPEYGETLNDAWTVFASEVDRGFLTVTP